MEEAYQSNLSLLKREQKKMHDFLQKSYITQMDQKIDVYKRQQVVRTDGRNSESNLSEFTVNKFFVFAKLRFML